MRDAPYIRRPVLELVQALANDPRLTDHQAHEWFSEYVARVESKRLSIAQLSELDQYADQNGEEK